MRLGPWLLGPALGLLGAGLVALVGRVPPGPSEPWYERARQVQPVRQVVTAVRLLWLVLALLAAGLPAFAAPSPWRWPLTLAAAWLPPLLAALGVEVCTRASLALYNDADDVEALVEGLHHARKVLA